MIKKQRAIHIMESLEKAYPDGEPDFLIGGLIDQLECSYYFAKEILKTVENRKMFQQHPLVIEQKILKETKEREEEEKQKIERERILDEIKNKQKKIEEDTKVVDDSFVSADILEKELNEGDILDFKKKYKPFKEENEEDEKK